VWCIALIAQLVEQLPLKQTVVGSTPTGGTKYKKSLKRLFLYFVPAGKSSDSKTKTDFCTARALLTRLIHKTIDFPSPRCII
jgi:hypothetical protein